MQDKHNADKVDRCLEILLPTLRAKWINQVLGMTEAENYAQKEGKDLVQQLSRHYYEKAVGCIKEHFVKLNYPPISKERDYVLSYTKCLSLLTQAFSIKDGAKWKCGYKLKKNQI